MTATGLAISAILCLAFGVWMVRIALEPKRWRLQWLDTLGMLDTDTNRDDRRLQEGQLRFMAVTLCVLLISLGGSCAYWSFELLQDGKRGKTTMERELDLLRRQADSARWRK